MRIIEPTIEDLVTKLDDLTRLASAYGAEFDALSVRTPLFISTLAATIGNPSGLVMLLASDEGQIMGVMAGHVNTDTLTGEHIAVQTILMTVKKMRGHTRSLISKFEQWAKEEGCSKVYIHTGPDQGRHKRRETVLAHSGYLPAMRCYVKEI